MLRVVITSLLGILCMALAATANAAPESLPIKTINGKQYYSYTVKSGETVYSLCRQLGISREELLAVNPSVAEGLKAYQEILIPVKTTATERTHKVQKGETAYGISHQYGLTLDQFYSLNPQAIDGLRQGEEVKVAMADPIAPVAEPAAATGPKAVATAGNTYKVQPGDTFYGISRRYGISVDELKAANPGVDMLVEGTEINLPQGCEFELSPSHQMLSSFVIADAYADTIYIAVPLEFTRQDRPDVRSMDFLRGMMMAADSLRSYGKPIALLVYDIASSETAIETALADPRLKKAKVIVGPFGTEAFKRFSAFARGNGIYIINNFLIKDESQRTNPFVMQSSLPHDLFYGAAADYFVAKFPDVTTVFLQSTSNNRKAEMVDVMQKRLLDAGRQYMVLKFKDEVDPTDLAKLPAGASYAFITNTDSLPAIAPAIEKLAEMRPSDNMYVWGYHDWLRHAMPGYKSLENCNGYIFSRFFVEAVPTEETKLGERYKYWYGAKPSDNLPHWYAYGFDCGMYLIKALNANGGDFRGYTPSHIGEEYMFNFMPMGDDKGLTNSSEVMIQLRPGNVRFKHIL